MDKTQLQLDGTLKNVFLKSSVEFQSKKLFCTTIMHRPIQQVQFLVICFRLKGICALEGFCLKKRLTQRFMIILKLFRKKIGWFLRSGKKDEQTLGEFTELDHSDKAGYIYFNELWIYTENQKKNGFLMWCHNLCIDAPNWYKQFMWIMGLNFRVNTVLFDIIFHL